MRRRRRRRLEEEEETIYTLRRIKATIQKRIQSPSPLR